MTYQCRHFGIEELVPPETIAYFEVRGGKQRAWEIFSDEALLCLDLLRDDHGYCTINDWLWNGPYRDSGFRPRSSDCGSEYSYHRIARGFDLKFRDASPDEVRENIRQNRERFNWVRGLELGWTEKDGVPYVPLTWVHIDNRNRDDLLEFWV